MALHRIKKGLELPISGAPKQEVVAGPSITRVAIIADDFHGMKPRMVVKEGDSVKRGQPLFEDRKNPGVWHTAPGAGRVIGVNRGARRALLSVVIHLNEAEQSGKPTDEDFHSFEAYSGKAPDALTDTEVESLLLESGLWTSLRTRPFSRQPVPGTRPSAIFVTATDSNPFAAEPKTVLAGREADFEAGLKLVSKLTAGKTYLCTKLGSGISGGDAPVSVEEFSGPHPSGTAGVHIHTLAPVNRKRTVWQLNYQDVIAIGRLFATGKLDVERVVSIAGPVVKSPRIVTSRLGAYIDELLEGEFDGQEGTKDAIGAVRIISGSVFSGKRAVGTELGYLARYDLQVSVLSEGNQRELLGWLAPGTRKFSVIPVFVAKLFGLKNYEFNTSLNGSVRAMVPIGMYEKVMPMDILPTFLLRALVVEDLERAEKLGALELDEEDLALCTFVCPGKTNYGPILRHNLAKMEQG